ncbi:MAG: hypothetical protein P8163_00195 [Candidatus Thiodiazotropha sp.]
MHLVINAWLERQAPYLQIIDSSTREIFAHFDSTALYRLLDEGIVSLEELTSSRANSRKSLLLTLLVEACCQRIRCERNCQKCACVLQKQLIDTDTIPNAIGQSTGPGIVSISSQGDQIFLPCLGIGQ